MLIFEVLIFPPALDCRRRMMDVYGDYAKKCSGTDDLKARHGNVLNHLFRVCESSKLIQ